MAELTPAVTDPLIWSDQVTPYDQQHFITYARLLDAEAEHADWHDVARIVLRLDPESNPDGARRCWQAHLARAKWIVTTGVKQMVEQSEETD
ncbi:DUF2285 domain-containing protein [Acidiphilium iwatense]|uniref:DUF2285 domain-containing protein n=1 Tax=Acidiphilium iwatense TaxID=768198 RepID=A0ABS9E2T8_9PROT|nr:DUF2285 domain-containing protein [Acidiphilium iwatense]MCF3947967.1 DUF2285 domain-containing protein [Acidiphilium iwatense]